MTLFRTQFSSSVTTAVCAQVLLFLNDGQGAARNVRRRLYALSSILKQAAGRWLTRWAKGTEKHYRQL
eukprot:6196900-Pleurochrysis_carterae.AAC.4